ncbi:MAG: PQQ-binding-like beta-propeller repeat protein [bacterium]
MLTEKGSCYPSYKRPFARLFRRAIPLLILFLSSCGGAGNEGKGTVMVSGFVDGEVRDRVLVTVSGGRNLQTRTETNGFYHFSLPGGKYTLTASMPDYLVIPESREVVVSGTDSPNNNFLLVKDLKSSVLWCTAVGGGIASSPATGRDGVVYVGSSDGSLYAFQSTGDPKWSYATQGAIQSSPAIGQRGTIYFGSDDHCLYAVNPDGKRQWSYRTGGAIQSSPAVDDFGRIYVGSDDSSLYAFSPGGGMLWSYRTAGAIQSSPAVDANGIIYAGSSDGNLYALSAQGGLKWKFPTGGPIRASAVIGADNTIYIGSCDHILYAITPLGARKWAFPSGGPIRSSCALDGDGTIYFGSDDHCLYALNADGTRKWAYQATGAVSSSPGLDQAHIVYFGCDDGTLYALTPQGTVYGLLQAGEGASSGRMSPEGITPSPCLTGNEKMDGRIYVSSSDGKLSALANPARGAATSVWPMFRKECRHQGALPLSLLCSVSGRVTGDIQGRVSMSLRRIDSDEAITTETAVDGTFRFTDIRPGIYILLPTREGSCFTPKSIEVTVSGVKNEGYDFTSSRAFRLTGEITGPAARQGVTVRAARGGTLIDTAISDAGGKFSFSLPQGSYVLTPSLDGYTFSPQTCSISLTGDSDDPSFLSLLRAYIISGSVAGDAQDGVALYLDGNTIEGNSIRGMTTSRANGSFEFTVYRGCYRITPSLAGYSFQPSSRQIRIESASHYVGNNFIAHAASQQEYTLSGTISGDVRDQVILTLSGDLSRTTASDSQGRFSFRLPDGHYVLTASKAGYSFSPAQREITIQGADSSGNNFSAVQSSLYPVSGKVTGDVTEGITLTLTNSGGVKTAETLTDGQGNFSLSAAAGSYTLRPDKAGCTFEPTSLSITVQGSGIFGLQFTSSRSSGIEQWSVPVGGRIFSGLALGSDGTIYAGSYDDYKILAMNPDGSIKWFLVTQGPVFASPVVDPKDGTIYTGSSDHYLYALNPQGGVKWKTALTDKIMSTAALGSDGTVYVGCNDGCLYALDPKDGRIRWSSQLENMVSSPAVGADGTIYVGAGNWTDGGHFYAVKATDGGKKWIADIYTLSRPALGKDGTIYVGSKDKNIYALNPSNGTPKWDYLTGGEVVSSPVLGPDGTIYIGSDDCRLYALNPNGSLRWSAVTEGEVRSSAAIGPDGTVYIGSHDYYLYAFDPVTGNQKWRFLTEGGKITAIPIIGKDGTIYIGSQNGQVYAIHGK